MATSFPSGLDSFTNPTAVDTLDSPPHDVQHADANDAIEALQAKVGVDGSAVTSSLDYRVAAVEQTLSGRNLVYNGAFQVAQRGTSVAGISTGGECHTADRWNLIISGLGTWTQSVENDAPTGSGFVKSLKMLCTTADAAPAAADWGAVQQIFEGQDLQHIKKGTSAAEQLTLSFWVKSNVTGTYVACVLDNDNSRICSATYTVSSSATWELKTITFPADTTGALDNDNNGSFRVQFPLGGGSDWTSGTLNTTWAATVTANRLAGQTNLAAATNNYWQITGVQLETGPVATPFEHLPFGVELARCERYYQKSYSHGTAPGSATQSGSITTFYSAAYGASAGFQFHAHMRAAPTLVLYAPPTGTASRVDSIGVGDATYSLGEIGDGGVRYVTQSLGTSGIVVHYTANAEL